MSQVGTGGVVDEAVLVVVQLTSATPEAVARALGRSEAEAEARLQALAAEGWLAFWPAGGSGRRRGATLTPWAAERLGVRLDEDSRRWVPVETPPLRMRVRRRPRTILQSTLDRRRRRGTALDRRDHRQYEPWLQVATGEESERALARGLCQGVYNLDRLPIPTVLLGLALPWDGPEITPARRRCRACGNARLRPHEYCLRCDNWGLDRRIPVEFRPQGLRRRRRPARRR
jgi:hypothetical protein